MQRFLILWLFLAAILAGPATSWATTSTSGNLAINVTPAPTVTNQTIESVQLSGSSVQFAASGPYYVGTLTTNLSPQTPTFNNVSGASYQLVASGGSCSGGDTTHFQINGDGVYTNTLAAGTYTLCITASATGVTPYTATFTGITEGHKIDAAATYCANNGGGNGSSSSPWHTACLQAAVNAAVAGDTVYLAAGNWELSTGDSAPVVISGTVNLLGAGSGNTFSAQGQITNGSGSDLCPTSSSTITCVETVGTTDYSYQTEPLGGGAGYILYGSPTSTDASCANITIAHIFVDGSLHTDGGFQWGTLNVEYCSGPITITDIRALAYNGSNASITSEGQFYINRSSNVAVQNSVFAEPVSGISGMYYPNQQVFQQDWGVNFTISNNIFYMESYNPIYLDSLNYVGNTQILGSDAYGYSSVVPSFALAGCETYPTGCYPNNTGSIGDVGMTVANNYFYANIYSNTIGGGFNDPTTNGGTSDMNFTGNWVFAQQPDIDACVWRYAYEDVNTCTDGYSSGGMQINDYNLSDGTNSAYAINVVNNSIVGTTSAMINMTGTGYEGATSSTNPAYGSGTTDMTVVNFNGHNNYLSSPSNQLLTDSNTVYSSNDNDPIAPSGPHVSNNYCSSAPSTWDVGSCATSGFTTPPTTSFTLGYLEEVILGGAQTYVAPINSPTFTAQYGAVEWLASSSPTTPTLSGQSGTGCDGSACLWGYVPPIYLAGVTHGNTVYLWAMDSLNHISAAASAVIP
jgi:hypothetical protein